MCSSTSKVKNKVTITPGGSVVKDQPAKQETQARFLAQEEKEMATHSSILAWEIPWTQEPGGV